jgi:hypothetical protein
MTTPFTALAFAATGASRLRTLPDRLNDIINVKDFGAVGDGMHDDAAAIQAAIDYGFRRMEFGRNIYRSGITVYVPPGVYWIGNAQISLTASQSVTYLGGSIGYSFVGAGRDATIIKGDNPDFMLINDSRGGQTFEYLADLTIWNVNTKVASVLGEWGAGCLKGWGWDGGGITNVRFKGVNGLGTAHDIYNISVTNCIAECVIPNVRADAATPGRPSDIWVRQGGINVPALTTGAVGFGGIQGEMVACQAIGFDIGFCVTSVGAQWLGCRASRCGIGFAVGMQNSGSEMITLIQGGAMLGCVADRCRWGLYTYNSGAGLYASNVFTGSMSRFDPAPISAMSWDSGSHFVTVTTPTAHNLATGMQKLVLVNLNPSALAPTGIVTATRLDATRFTFPGPASNPGPFVSGSWNYLAEYNIAVGTANRATFASNVFLAPTSGSDFDLNNAGRPGNQVGQTDLMTMSGNFTMLPGNANWGPNAYQPMAGSVSHRQCPIPAWVKMAGLSYGEGSEFDVIDAQTRAVGDVMGVQLVTNANTTPGNTTLHFASVPTSVQPGMYVNGPYLPDSHNSVVQSVTSTTVVVSNGPYGTLPAGSNVQFYYGHSDNHYRVRHDGTNFLRIA